MHVKLHAHSNLKWKCVGGGVGGSGLGVLFTLVFNSSDPALRQIINGPEKDFLFAFKAVQTNYQLTKQMDWFGSQGPPFYLNSYFLARKGTEKRAPELRLSAAIMKREAR